MLTQCQELVAKYRRWCRYCVSAEIGEAVVTLKNTRMIRVNDPVEITIEVGHLRFTVTCSEPASLQFPAILCWLVKECQSMQQQAFRDVLAGSRSPLSNYQSKPAPAATQFLLKDACVALDGFPASSLCFSPVSSKGESDEASDVGSAALPEFSSSGS